jgi:hypothetical protein
LFPSYTLPKGGQTRKRRFVFPRENRPWKTFLSPGKGIFFSVTKFPRETAEKRFVFFELY